MFDIASKLFDRLVENGQGCLEFTGALDTSGYGIVWVGKNKGAHILAYQYYKGEIPNGMLVCHHCDNPRCCNIEHLFLGTRQDNYNDMVSKNREYIRKGEEIHTCVLTEEAVLEIYKLLDEGHTQRFIGSLYGVSHSIIGQINRGVSWKHLYREHRQ